ncbi:MAG: DegT/DnrJ/EryC1/StrS family aminotransferase [Oleiphilaceae bacterium]|nr:DegT/DnrJ/EryC1/StrS family aminotransferase [Oleiphilaceae bacterium]
MIPMVDIAAGHTALQEDIANALKDIVATGQFVGGPHVQGFEKEAATFLGAPYAISCASGTDALHMALRALDIGPGDEVITTPFTYFATVEAIFYVGAKPVFVDIDPHTFNIDVSQLEEAVTPATRAIVPVHIFGQPAAMDQLMPLAKKHHLHVVEDCAQSFGARHGADFTGTFGDVGCFSFFPTKNLGACGDGGLMTTHSPELADKLRLLCSHGSNERNHHKIIGYNSRLDSMQAAILRIKLNHVHECNRARRQVADWYREGLGDVSGIEAPTVNAGGDHVYHQFTILVPEQVRETIRHHLSEQGIASAIHYALPAYRQQALPEEYHSHKLPVAESVTARCLSLPIYPEMSREQVDRVVQAVRESW